MKKLTSILTMALLLMFSAGLTSCQGLIDAVVGEHTDDTPTQPTPAPTPTPVTVKATEQPLTFEALVGNTTVTFKLTDDIDYTKVEYSLDKGTTWNQLASANQAITLLNAGDQVMFRGANASYNGNGQFIITKAASTRGMSGEAAAKGMTRANNSELLCHVFGNILSLIKSDGFAEMTELAAENEGAFKNLFADCPIDLSSDEAKALVLPATTLVKDCYDNMFSGCTTLTKAPELPAQSLAENCYNSMFSNCASLEKTPELPAQTLAENCYNSMFKGCESLKEVAELPATTLEKGCYNSMFTDCKSLTEAPVLPATTLVSECYTGMFENCESLTSVTILATEVAEGTEASECVSNVLSGAGTKAETAPVVTVAETSTIAAADIVAASGDNNTTWTVQDEKENIQYAIVISQSSLPLFLGDGATLTAKLTPEVATGELTWTSSDESIVTVDGGKLTTKGVGQATIKAAYGEGEDQTEATCKVTVREIPTVQLNKTKLEMAPGEEFQLVATVSPANAPGIIRWKALDESIVSVDENGKLTAHMEGEAGVDAAYYEGDKDLNGTHCTIIVKKKVENNTIQAPDGFQNAGNPFTSK